MCVSENRVLADIPFLKCLGKWGIPDFQNFQTYPRWCCQILTGNPDIFWQKPWLQLQTFTPIYSTLCPQGSIFGSFLLKFRTHTHTQYHPIRSSNNTRAKSWRKIPTFLLHSGQWIDFFTQRIVLLDIFCKPPCWMKQSFREEILCICSRNVVRISDLAWRKSTLW